MSANPISSRFRRLKEQALLTADVTRALRSTVAFIVPLIWFQRLGRPDIGIFVATAALGTGHKRITRALTVVGVQLNRGLKLGGEELTGIAQASAAAMETLAKTLEAEPAAPTNQSYTESPGVAFGTAKEPAPANLIFNLLARINTELDAMKLAIRPAKAQPD